MDTPTYKELADAIRVGASKTQQAFGNLYKTKTGLDTDRKDRAAASCALGALYIGHPAGARLRFSEIMRSHVHSPASVYGQGRFTLQNVIVTLNDSARWSREQIADWLETL